MTTHPITPAPPALQSASASRETERRGSSPSPWQQGTGMEAFVHLMARRKEKSHSLLALPGSCVGLAALGSTPKISGGSMGFPRYSLWGESKVPGSQQGPHGTPCSSDLCLGTPHSSSTTQPRLASIVPVSAGATHPRGFQSSGTEPGAIPVSSHPSPAPCASVAACAVPRGLQAGHCVPGTCAACPGHPSSTRAMLCPRQDAPVPHAGGCQEARASHRKPGSRRELAQPEGLGVCRARCVLGSPGSTYPAPVPTQRGAGRPAGAQPDPRARRPGSALPGPPAQPVTWGAVEGSGCS